MPEKKTGSSRRKDLKLERCRLLLSFLLILFLLTATPALARKMSVLTPYLGQVENSYRDEANGLALTDAQPIRGVYAQWLDTEKYQANIVPIVWILIRLTTWRSIELV